MRHPFDGLITEAMTRRGALGCIAGAAAGLGAVAKAMADPPVATTLAIGEEGGRPKLTQALNETGRTTAALNEDGKKAASTEPFGEEAGRVTSFVEPGKEDGKAPTKTTKALKEEGGVVTTQAIGEEGARPTTKRAREEGAIATTRALGEEGALTRARFENGGPVRARPIVPVQPNSLKLTDKQIESIWAEMANKESTIGVQACAKLYGAKGNVKFLSEHLSPESLKIPKADAATIAKLITDLDSRFFAARTKAQEELVRLGPAAEQAIEKALLDPKSMEQKMRLQQILKKIKDQPKIRQAQRGLEVLVALRTDEAKALLQKLAKGTQGEWLTQAAQSALKRVPN